MSGDLSGFGRLIRENKDFRRLWFSHMISLLGDWLSYIAVAVISIEKGQGALAVGMVLFVHSLPTALISPIAGPLADSVDRKKLIIAGYIGAAVLTVGMWGAADLGSVWLLQGVLFIRVCVSGIAMTARSASIPAIVGRADLRIANALLGLTWSVMFTLGLALGGFATEFLSPSGAILLDSLSFLLAAAVAAGLPSLKPEVSEDGPPRPGVADMLIAWRFIVSRPQLLSTVLSKTPPMIANAGGWVALNLLAGPRLAPLTTAIALGVLQSARAIGTGLGPLTPARLVPHNPLLGPLFVFVGIALFAIFDSIWISCLAVCLWGAGGGHNWVIATADTQAATPDHLLGRVTSIDFFLFCIGQAGAAVLAGALCDAWDSPTVGAWATMGLAFILWSYCLVLRRKASTTDSH